jgi:plastocyanin
VTVVMLVVMLAGLSASASAVDAPREAAVVVRNQAFSPAEIRVKAGAPFILVITNQDKSAARFESQSLKIEKLILPGQTVRMRVPALARGTYPFANGRIVAE